MIKKSVFTIEGKQYNVLVDSPDDLVNAIGEQRSNDFVRSFGHAHWVQTGTKAAFVKAPDKRNAKDNEIVRKVINGEPLTFMDFVPDARGQSVSKSDLQVANAAWDALEAGTITEAMLEESYKKVGLEYKSFGSKEEFIAMHANKKRVERSPAGKSLV